MTTMNIQNDIQVYDGGYQGHPDEDYDTMCIAQKIVHAIIDHMRNLVLPLNPDSETHHIHRDIMDYYREIVEIIDLYHDPVNEGPYSNTFQPLFNQITGRFASFYIEEISRNLVDLSLESPEEFVTRFLEHYHPDFFESNKNIYSGTSLKFEIFDIIYSENTEDPSDIEDMDHDDPF